MGSLLHNSRFKDKKESLKTCLNCFGRSVRKRLVVTAAAIATRAHTASGTATVTTTTTSSTAIGAAATTVATAS